jgi:folate-dependent phosphoribosylglycinamide formyltransferase PurN
MRWIALFSYTGTELCQVIKKLGRDPDLVITNNPDKINDDGALGDWVGHCISNRPTVGEYDAYFNIIDTDQEVLITLHGWNRIIPAEICNKYTIYNIHPGDVIKYPQLIGADPQKKAVRLQLPTSGIIIHQVTPEVDQGPIIKHVSDVDIIGLTVQEVTNMLRDISIDCWVDVLNNFLKTS